MVVVYYVIAPALSMRSSYREVLRCLREGVQWLLHPSATVKMAGKSGISQARSRLESLDGSTLDVADTAENHRAFGRPGANRGSSAYSKIRSEQYCT